MFKSWRLGRMFGFPVEINLSFLLLLAVVLIAFGGLSGLFVVAIAFGSVLLHELGHALVARRLGVHVSGIELSFFGGAAKMMDLPRSANHEIAIAAAGPAVSLMLGGLGFGLGAALGVPLLAAIGWINFVIAGFNLIPALPMDGGRILRALLTRRMSFVRATDVAVTVSRVVAVGFGVIGLLGAFAGSGTFQLLLLAPLLWIMGTRERMLARSIPDPYASHRRGGVDVFRRGAGPFEDPYDPYDARPERRSTRSGFTRWADADAPVRRFTIRRVHGRTVIEAID
jgi:Zn-dependent protease